MLRQVAQIVLGQLRQLQLIESVREPAEPACQRREDPGKRDPPSPLHKGTLVRMAIIGDPSPVGERAALLPANAG